MVILFFFVFLVFFAPAQVRACQPRALVSSASGVLEGLAVRGACHDDDLICLRRTALKHSRRPHHDFAAQGKGDALHCCVSCCC